MNWKKRKVLVTGGASFIGSCLVESLLARGADIRVVDNLSSGRVENIKEHMDVGTIEFVKGNLLEPGVIKRAMEGMEVVFPPRGGPWWTRLCRSSSGRVLYQSDPGRYDIQNCP